MNADAAICIEEELVTDSAGDRIFRAASELFYQQGIRAVGVEAIAAAAGTTKMSLYRTFGSKDELVAAVLRAQDREFWKWWNAAVAPFEGRPRQQIEQLFREFEGYVSDDTTCRGCPIANASVEIVEDDHPAREVMHGHHRRIREQLTEMCRKMGAREPVALGDALMLLMGGCFVSRLVFPDAGPVASIYHSARVLLDSPLGAPESAAQAAR